MGEREVVGEQGDLFEQRWRDKRSTWAPLHTLFDPSRYEVVVIDQDKIAKTFVTHHHYSGTYPAARFRVGLVRDDELVGVAIFSTPASQKVLPRYAEITPDEGVELGRFVLLDDVAFNGESWFLARAFKLLKREKGSRFVLSFSDPIARTSEDGEVIKPGHIGQIYKALNASYFGQVGSPATLMLLPNGRVMSPRSLGKIRRGERGKDYALDQLLRAGAPAPRSGESGEAYVHRVSPSFRKLRHPGNLAYGWSLDKHVEVRLPTVPYLKENPYE